MQEAACLTFLYYFRIYFFPPSSSSARFLPSSPSENGTSFLSFHAPKFQPIHFLGALSPFRKCEARTEHNHKVASKKISSSSARGNLPDQQELFKDRDLLNDKVGTAVPQIFFERARRTGNEGKYTLKCAELELNASA